MCDKSYKEEINSIDPANLKKFYDFYTEETGKDQFYFTEIMGKRWSFVLGYDGISAISPIRITLNERWGVCFDRKHFSEVEIENIIMPKLRDYLKDADRNSH